MSRANFLGGPAFFDLNHACRAVTDAFGYSCYLVGSALKRRDYRDVDVRCILSDEDFDRLFSMEQSGLNATYNARWSLLTVAISQWLSKRSGLPVDFQFQRRSDANIKFPGPRHALGIFIGNATDGRP